MKKYLIIRFSSIGDIVLTTPVVRCLKEQTNAQVHYLSKAQFSSILKPNPFIDKLHFINKDVDEVIPELKAEGFDEIIDLHNNLRTLRIKRALGIKSTSFEKHNVAKWFLVNLKWNTLPNVHIVDRYIATVKHLGVVNDMKGLDYFLTKEDEVDLKNFEEGNWYGKPFVAFVIGGQHEGKMCSTKKIIEICKRIEQPVLLFGGPEDQQKGAEIEKACQPNVLNIAGKFSLGQSAFILSKASVVITHDTGLMHIAAAFNKKIISLWGGTVPELGMYPYLPGEGSQILEVKHFMRPSSKLGSRKGIYRLWNFMDMIPTDKIVSAIQEKTTP